MSPMLKDGDRVLVVRHCLASWLRHGQIVIITRDNSVSDLGHPLGSMSPFIKRIVGMPGDTLTTSITELNSFLRPRERGAYDASGHRAWHVPPGHVFVRGDNPTGGLDSLSWGPIPVESVVGIAIMKLPYRAPSMQCHFSGSFGDRV